jgi:Glycoside hydrolase family 44
MQVIHKYGARALPGWAFAFAAVCAAVGAFGCRRKEAKPELADVGPQPIVGLKVNCRGKTTPISPLIYGIAFDPTGFADTKNPKQWVSAPTARRFGGNGASRYNFEHGTALNHGSDWFFLNSGEAKRAEPLYLEFLRSNAKHGAVSALQVPAIGWVAKDTQSGGFPVAQFPGQKSVEPSRQVGNGTMISGREIEPPPPTQTSVAFPPERAAAMVLAFARESTQLSALGPRIYILDNEPGLWNSTHRDVHPSPLTYDELLDRVIRYGTAVREKDPAALIAAPAAHGWIELLYSAKDQAAGVGKKPDRRAHDDKPLLPWLLAKLKAHEAKTGVRLIDLVDIHFYPQTEGVGVGVRGETGLDTSTRRIRSVRGLYDPNYVDESWIAEPVEMLPRVRRYISENYPGLRIQVGEWNFGAEKHISGGIATALALGAFATEGIYSAFYWAYPTPDSAADFAFRAFRNFDGKGAHFQDTLVEASAEPGLALFASKDASGKHMVLIAINTEPQKAAELPLDLGSCGEVTSVHSYQYRQNSSGLVSQPVSVSGSVVTPRLESYSINVFDVQLR